MHSFKQAECIQFLQQHATPSKAYIPAYPRKVELLNLVITLAIMGTYKSILHWTA
jgi:hypothetical protein